MNKLHALFQKIDFPHPSDGLGERILHRIKTIEANRLRRAILITRIGRIISLAAFLYTGFSFGHSVIASDFWQITTLLFSDGNIVINYFSDFFISLLETIPALSITLILMPIFSFLLFQFWSQGIGTTKKHVHAYN